MPTRKIHNQVTALFFGEDTAKKLEWVCAMKDKPSKWLGRGHRVLFHDHATNLAIGLISGDYRAYIASELHDLLDFSETKSRANLKSTRPR